MTMDELRQEADKADALRRSKDVCELLRMVDNYGIAWVLRMLAEICDGRRIGPCKG